MTDPSIEVAARSLGLSVRGEVDWELERCFARLRRAITRSDPNGERRCLAGAWKGRSVVVRWVDDGRGSWETHVIAALDPPLLLCFMVRPGDYATRHVDAPWFDAGYVIHTYDDRVFARLAESARQRSLSTLHDDAGAATFRVTDTFACVAIASRIERAEPLAMMLERACDLAAGVGAELSDLHDTEWHRGVREVWRSVAEARALAFDEERFAIRSTVGAAEIELALEAEHDNVATALEVRLPEGTSFGVDMIDDPAVLDTPTGSAVPDPRAKDALVELCAEAPRCRVRGGMLYARWPKPFDQAKRIDTALSLASTIAVAFAPTTATGPALGPYR